MGRLLLRLIEPTAGDVRYEGRSILKLDKTELRRLRRELQIIFQDPYASLNPRMNVGDIVGEPIWLHDLAVGREKRERVADLMRTVGLLPTHADRYPHEFSGGQRQRIGIARALAGDPKLIIGDEPVSALDVSIQAQIINLLEDLKDRFGLTLVIVAHDLAVIRHMSDRVAVMYLGEIVELSRYGRALRQPAASLYPGAAGRDPDPEPVEPPAEGAARRAMCRAPPRRRPAAASTPAAPMRVLSARSSIPPSRRRRTGGRWPAISGAKSRERALVPSARRPRARRSPSAWRSTELGVNGRISPSRRAPELRRRHPEDDWRTTK